MAYDQQLARRISTILGNRPGIVEKKMFGGVGYILHGNLVCGVQRNDLIVRVGADKNDQALSRLFVRPFMVMAGKPMAGWVLVAPEGLTTEQDLSGWIEQGFVFAQSLPEKA